MKPKNFPARKLARQRAAAARREGHRRVAAWSYLMFCHGLDKPLDDARAARTKKNRGRA